MAERKISTIYKWLFLFIFVSMFFSDLIVIKQGGILGQLAVLGAFVYLLVLLFEKKQVVIRETFKSHISLVFSLFLTVLVISFFVSDISWSIEFKNEQPLLKFVKQFISILVWAGVFTIPIHFIRSGYLKTDWPKWIFFVYYLLLIIGSVEWVLFLVDKEIQVKYSSLFHSIFPSPYTNVYTWFIDYPRFRLVEGEPVHTSVALQFFAFLFIVVYAMYPNNQKYRIMASTSIVVAVVFNFWTFSRSGYLGMLLILLVFAAYLITEKFNNKKQLILGSTLILIVFQTGVTFPFMGDSVVSYFNKRFNTNLIDKNIDTTNIAAETDGTESTVAESTNNTDLPAGEPATSGINSVTEPVPIAQNEMSNNTRAISAFMSLDMFKDSPFFGMGWGQYGFYFARYFKPYEPLGANNYEFIMYNDPNDEHFWPEQHSFLLRLISETGLLGTLTFLGILICIYWPALRHLRTYRKSRTSRMTVLISLSSGVILAQFLLIMSGLNLLYLPFLFGLVYWLVRYLNIDIQP